ncbi:uroporphyrinogen-III synthase [Bordetella muralis]|uniref:uroporphyrinogen-III synthase n=1 Tax=Bordetella muralis TaxID=1649130 RepID=UPI0039EFA733
MSHIAILTRPAGRNDALAQALGAAGWQTLDLPALELRPLAVASADLPLPQDFDLVIFVSGHAARTYLNQLRDLAGQTDWPAAVSAATVGPASARALRETPGFCANTTVFCPPPAASTHDSEALWQVLRAQDSLPNRVLLVRGTQGRDWLADQLEAAGAQVRRHAAYERQPAQWLPSAVEQLRKWAQMREKTTWLLTSGEGLTAVEAHIHEAGLADWWQASDFIVTHPTLARRLQQGLAGKVTDAMVKICLPADDAILAAFVAA